MMQVKNYNNKSTKRTPTLGFSLCWWQACLIHMFFEVCIPAFPVVSWTLWLPLEKHDGQFEC